MSLNSTLVSAPVLGHIRDVIKDQEVAFVELGNSSFQVQLAAGDLEFLNQVGGPAEERAPTVLDESETEPLTDFRRCRAGPNKSKLAPVSCQLSPAASA
jgi:predicted nucleic acid-binding OB-fold protein